MIFDITITREYRVEAQSEAEAREEALRLEERAAHEWPMVVEVRVTAGIDCEF